MTLIGSNGAGKSTTLRAITGLTPASSGSVVIAGEDITRVPAHQIVDRGIALSPEGRHCFPRMTVRENLDLGAHRRRRDPSVSDDMDRIFELFPRLKEREKQKAGTMSGGEQQMLAMGRALMAKPKILLLDEPSMGIAPILVQRIYETIAEINRGGMTILLSSRTPTTHSTYPNAATCLRPVAWCWRASRPACATILKSNVRTWGPEPWRSSR